jgi:hypothetical protein
MTALDERNVEMSDSEEEEYDTSGVVYDSDETDEDCDDGDGSNLSDDKRKVLVLLKIIFSMLMCNTNFPDLPLAGLFQSSNLPGVILHSRLFQKEGRKHC